MRLTRLSTAIFALMMTSTAMAEPVVDRLDSNMTRADAEATYANSGKPMIKSADFAFSHHYGSGKDQWADVYVVFRDKSSNSPIRHVLMENRYGGDAKMIAASLTAKYGQPTNRADVSKYATPGWGIRQDETETTIEWQTDTMVIELTASDTSNAWRVKYEVKQKLAL